MKKALRRTPSASMVVALIALFVAASGTAVAASKLVNGDKLIAKHSLSGNRLRNGTLTGRQINLAKLGKVPSATNADHANTASNATNATNASDATTIDGQPPSAFFPASKVQTFNVKLAFGQTQPLFSVGTLTFSAKCVNNGTDPNGGLNQDFSELLVATSKDGGILSNGRGGGLHGTDAADFLNTDTTEANRAVAFVGDAAGSSYGAVENNGGGWGMDVVDPNGVTVIFPDGLTGAVNLFGTNCLMAGFAIIP